MPWQLALSLAISASVILALVQRHYSIRSKVPTSFPPAASYVLGVMPIGVGVGLLLPHHIDWTWEIAILLVGNAVAIGVANWLLFGAVRQMPVAQFQVIKQFYAIAAIVLGWIFLKEGLSLGQTVGAALLFIAALLSIVASKKRAQVKLKSYKPVVIAAVGALLLGTSLVIEKAGLGHMDIGAWLIFGWSAQTLAMIILALKDVNKQTIRSFGRNEFKWSAIMGLAAGTLGVFYIIALTRSDNISLITSLLPLTLPFIAIGAYLILKERENLRLLWASIVISTLGLLFMTLH